MRKASILAQAIVIDERNNFAGRRTQVEQVQSAPHPTTTQRADMSVNLSLGNICMPE